MAMKSKLLILLVLYFLPFSSASNLVIQTNFKLLQKYFATFRDFLQDADEYEEEGGDERYVDYALHGTLTVYDRIGVKIDQVAETVLAKDKAHFALSKSRLLREETEFTASFERLNFTIRKLQPCAVRNLPYLHEYFDVEFAQNAFPKIALSDDVQLRTLVSHRIAHFLYRKGRPFIWKALDFALRNFLTAGAELLKLNQKDGLNFLLDSHPIIIHHDDDDFIQTTHSGIDSRDVTFGDSNKPKDPKCPFVGYYISAGLFAEAIKEVCRRIGLVTIHQERIQCDPSFDIVMHSSKEEAHGKMYLQRVTSTFNHTQPYEVFLQIYYGVLYQNTIKLSFKKMQIGRSKNETPRDFLMVLFPVIITLPGVAGVDLVPQNIRFGEDESVVCFDVKQS